MSEWLRRLKPVIASGSLTVLALVGLEWGLRLAEVPDPGLYAGDPASVWWLRPGLDRELADPLTGRHFRVRTTPEGLRGPSPPPDGPWTLALGCSTTFGWGVDREEAWPAVLADLIDAPVVNGGQPGWSTHQAVAHLRNTFDDGPSRVILGFIIRDAWRGGRADRDARPTPWVRTTQLGRLLRRSPGSTASPVDVPTVGEFRVSPEDFVLNLSTLMDRVAPAAVVLLNFPHQHATPEHSAALEVLAEAHGLPLVAPVLDPSAYFAADPVHLNPSGHRQLAEIMATLEAAPTAPR